ncbi:MAG: phospholipid carrier-dependent glycosyltransferase [Chloroflexi bacterium]|nr:phospholipid carrier-dependent glycosyltransferase [Chloroflexota bacterium]
MAEGFLWALEIIFFCPVATVKERRSPAWALALVLFFALGSVYFLTYTRAMPSTADEVINLAVAENVAKFGRFDVDQLASIRKDVPQEYGLDGRHYSKYGIGQPLLSIPLYLLALWLPWLGNVDTVLLFNVLITAATAVFVLLIALELGWSQRVAMAVALLYGLATPAWVYAKHYFSEPLSALTLLACACFAIAAKRRGSIWLALLAGVAGSVAVATKTINGLFLAPMVVYLLWPDKGKLQVWLGRALAFGVPIGAALAGLGYYNWARFGNVLQTGYGTQEGFTTPLVTGLAGLLFSPGKSLFLYAPLLILVPFLLPTFLRRWPREGWLLLATAVIQLVVYAAWWAWWGGWSWGPRFLVPTLPFLVLLLGPGLGGLWQLSWGRWVIIGLIGVSVLVQMLGVAVDHTAYLASLLPLGPNPDQMTLWDPARNPILNQFRYLRAEYLDFAWANPIRRDILGAALGGVAVAGLAVAVILRGAAPRLLVPVALAAFILPVAYGLSSYHISSEWPASEILAQIADHPERAAIVFAAPSYTASFLNYNKLKVAVDGLGEEEELRPETQDRLESLQQNYRIIWLISEYGPADPHNGVERWLSQETYRAWEQWYGPIRLARFQTAPEKLAEVPLSARLGGKIELVSFTLNDGPYQPGEPLLLDLRWQALAPMAERYKIFVHLVSPQGGIAAQRDSEPVSGFRPTDGWQPGEIVDDRYAILIPSNASSGSYRLLAGLYLPSTGQRLPIIGSDGQQAGDALQLTLVEIETDESHATAR